VDAWDIETGDAKTVIAVIEGNGFEVGHPDLAPNLWANPGELGGDEDGNTFVGDVHGSPAGAIAVRPWGERSFYAVDPFGKRLCFVDERTKFTTIKGMNIEMD